MITMKVLDRAVDRLQAARVAAVGSGYGCVAS